MLLVRPGAVQATGPKDDFTGYAAVEERVQQQRLQSAHYNHSESNEDPEELSIMGWGKSRPSQLCKVTKSAKQAASIGGDLTLVNGSPFSWSLSYQHSYQMDTWAWPTINAGMYILD